MRLILSGTVSHRCGSPFVSSLVESQNSDRRCEQDPDSRSPSLSHRMWMARITIVCIITIGFVWRRCVVRGVDLEQRFFILSWAATAHTAEKVFRSLRSRAMLLRVHAGELGRLGWFDDSSRGPHESATASH